MIAAEALSHLAARLTGWKIDIRPDVEGPESVPARTPGRSG